MKRALAAIVALAAACVLAAGCTSPAGPAKAPRPAGQPTKVVPYAAIPDDGPHEKAAYGAVPAALDYVVKTTRQQKRALTDVTGATPTLVSYTLLAEAGGRIVLFEVRGDGKAYEQYRYPASPDPKKLFWQNDSASQGARLVKPLGPGETAAAMAVRKIVEAAAPGETVTVSMYGYNFYWLKKDGTPVNTPGGSPFTISIDPSGAAGSWSS